MTGLGDLPLALGAVAPARAAAILAAREATVAAAARAGPAEERRQLLRFRVGSIACALAIGEAAAVLPAAVATPVPGAPPALRGVLIAAGRLFNLVDPAAALGAEPAATEAPGHMLLLRRPRPRLALHVARVTGIAWAPAAPARATGLTTPVLTDDGERLALIALAPLVEAMGLVAPFSGV